MAGDGEVGGFVEKIIDRGLPSSRLRRTVGRRVFLVGVHRCYAEHLAGTFAVAGGDDGGVDVEEIAFVEEAVDGEGEAASHTEDGSVEIGAGAKVGDGAEELGGVAFFLEGVVVGGGADEFCLGGADFPSLAFSGALDEFAGDGDGGSGGHFVYLVIAGDTGIDDDLDAFEAGAVVDFQEGKLFGVAAGADPSVDLDGVEGGVALEGVFDRNVHGFVIPGGAIFAIGLSEKQEMRFEDDVSSSLFRCVLAIVCYFNESDFLMICLSA